MQQFIVIIEDDDDIAELIAYHLQKQGYRTRRAADGKSGLALIAEADPDLIILDLMLPVMDGLEVLKQLRYGIRSTKPVIIESARGEEADIIAGLEIGADDYIPKPFSPLVLVAKVKTLLRRVASDTEAEASSQVSTDHLTLDKERRLCHVDGENIDLTSTEFLLLFTLSSTPGRVLTRSQLISTTKGSDYPVTERSIDVQIATLRRKLKSAGRYLRTVWGVGYKYQEDDAS